MSEKEKAYQLLDHVPDYKMGYVVAYLQGVIIGEDEPNEDTIRAFAEIDKMKRTGNCRKYSSLDELWTSTASTK